MDIIGIIYIIVCIFLLYFTCSKLGYFLSLIIYIIIMGVLPYKISFLNFAIEPFWLNILIRFFIAIFLIKRLKIIYEQIESPKWFFITGILLEIIITSIMYFFTDYVTAIAIVWAGIALISIFRFQYYDQLLNNKMWLADNSSTIEGRHVINTTKAKRNFWGRWFQ